MVVVGGLQDRLGKILAIFHCKEYTVNDTAGDFDLWAVFVEVLCEVQGQCVL